MCSAGNNLPTRAMATFVLVLLVASIATPTAASDDRATASATGSGTDLKAVRRDAARTVAIVSMILVLILIVFIIVLMIANRRLRARYLGWHKKVRFKKLWDVWWSKEPPKE